MSELTIQIITGITEIITQAIEALAGFGATAVGLPFVSMLMKTNEASAVLNTNAFLVTSVIMIIKWKQIIWKEYAKLVLLVIPFLPIGLFVGKELKDYDMILKLILGVFIIFISLRYIYYTYIKRKMPATIPAAGQYTALFSGAVMQGLFGTGGPLFTLYTTNRIADKGQFRATMCAAWTTINAIVITSRMFIGGYYNKFTFSTILITFPFVVAGIFLGMWIHNKIHNSTFIKLVYWILLAGGLASLYSGVIKLI